MDKHHRRNAKKSNGPYSPFFHDMPMSPAWADLSGNAVKVLIVLLSQIRMKPSKNGRPPYPANNGDLSAGPMMIKKFGGPKSMTTVTRSVRELLDGGFIVLTEKRKGGKMPNLYALTCFPISDMKNKSFIGSTINASKAYLGP